MDLKTAQMHGAVSGPHWQIAHWEIKVTQPEILLWLLWQLSLGFIQYRVMTNIGPQQVQHFHEMRHNVHFSHHDWLMPTFKLLPKKKHQQHYFVCGSMTKINKQKRNANYVHIEKTTVCEGLNSQQEKEYNIEHLKDILVKIKILFMWVCFMYITQKHIRRLYDLLHIWYILSIYLSKEKLDRQALETVNLWESSRGSIPHPLWTDVEYIDIQNYL